GHLDALQINGSEVVVHSAQTASSSSCWSPVATWNSSYPVGFLGHPALARDGSGNVFAFARGNDSQLYVSQNQGSWIGMPRRTGLTFQGDPVAGLASSYLFVFGISADGRPFYSYRDIAQTPVIWTTWTGMYRLSQSDSSINAVALA